MASAHAPDPDRLRLPASVRLNPARAPFARIRPAPAAWTTATPENAGFDKATPTPSAQPVPLAPFALRTVDPQPLSRPPEDYTTEVYVSAPGHRQPGTRRDPSAPAARDLWPAVDPRPKSITVPAQHMDATSVRQADDSQPLTGSRARGAVSWPTDPSAALPSTQPCRPSPSRTLPSCAEPEPSPSRARAGIAGATDGHRP